MIYSTTKYTDDIAEFLDKNDMKKSFYADVYDRTVGGMGAFGSGPVFPLKGTDFGVIKVNDYDDSVKLMWMRMAQQVNDNWPYSKSITYKAYRVSTEYVLDHLHDDKHREMLTFNLNIFMP